MVFVFAFSAFCVSSCTDSGRQSASLGADGGKGGAGGEKSFEARGGAEPEFELRFRALEGLGSDSATDFAFVPGRLEVLQLTRGGDLLHLKLEQDSRELLTHWPFQEEMLLEDACVPTNILFDRDFPDRPFIYVTYCPDAQTNRLVRYQWDENNGPTKPAVIFELSTESSPELWHRFGAMGWESDEVLWLLAGDHNLMAAAQDASHPAGALLRLLPSRTPGQQGYQGAPGNLVDLAGSASGVHPAIYAFGFRSPWRGTRDRWGNFWVGDAGSDFFEEINRVTHAGQNFGWPLHEGPCTSSCGSMVEPVAFYGLGEEERYLRDDPSVSDFEQRAVWVGEAYSSSAQRPDRYQGLLTDVVVFGDLFSGVVRGLGVEKAGLQSDQALGHLPWVVAWREGPDGFVYVLDLYGKWYRAELAN